MQKEPILWGVAYPIKSECRTCTAPKVWHFSAFIIKVGNRMYKQCVRIPMGTDCTLLIAKLYLFFYEYNYMKSLLKLLKHCEIH